MTTTIQNSGGVARRTTGTLWIAGMLAVVFVLSGCASARTGVTRDPWENYNRSMTRFNDGVDAAILKPVATAYDKVTPPLVRTGVNNFFGNLGDLWSAVNSALQLKGRNALENLFRFNVNTFMGLGGILDVASEMNLERHREDFGQTLGRWGVGTGPYLVLPLLGPSTLRDAASLSLDRQGNLVSYVDDYTTRYTLYGLRAVEARANVLRAGNVLDEAALDKYSFSRDVFLQYRRAEIYDGDPPDLPEPPAAAPARPASAAAPVR